MTDFLEKTTGRTLRLMVLLALATCAAAQTTQPEEILRHCAQAMGSPQSSLSVFAEGETHVAGPEPAVPIRIKSRGIEDFRLERDVAGQTEVSIISKGRGWHHHQDKKWDISRHTTAYFRPDHLPALACAMSPSTLGLTAAYVGEDVVGSEAVFHIRLAAQPKGKDPLVDATESLLSEYHIFIAQKSFVVLKISKYIFSPNAVENHSLWEVFYSDYRSVNGVLMPFHIETHLSGRQFDSTIFTTVQTGLTFSDGDFKEVQ